MEKEIIKEAIIEALNEYENNYKAKDNRAFYWKILEIILIAILYIISIVTFYNMIPVQEGENTTNTVNYYENNKPIDVSIEKEVTPVSEKYGRLAGYSIPFIGVTILSGWLIWDAWRHSKKESVRRVTLYLSLITLISGLPLLD